MALGRTPFRTVKGIKYYKFLEYLQGDGTAYLDLNTAINQDDDIEIVANAGENQTSKAIFGYRTSASSNNILLFYGGTTNGVVLDFNNSNYATYRLGSVVINNSTKYKFVLNKNIRAIYNGSTLVQSNTAVCPDTITISDVYLFNAAGSPSTNGLYSGKIYSCVIKDKLNLVPAQRYDGELGMYDKVNGVFYTNAAGSGSFTGGPEVNE